MDGNNRSTALLVVVVVFLLIMCRCCLADFAEVPSSVTINVSEDQNALFRCRHEQVDAVISWLINGISSSRYRDVDPYFIQESNGTIVDTLTIPAIPVYNGTEVVCVAIVTNGSPEETSPVMLTITAPPTKEPVTVAPTTTQPTTTEPMTTTTQPTTTEPMTTTTQPTSNPGDFPTVPSPPVLIVTMKERHVYMCNHSETINIFWRVNGSILNVKIFPIGIDLSTLPLPGGGRVYTLTIGGRLEHNATTIQCSARLSGGSEVMTPSVSFFIQGPLQSVNNLERRNTTILWEAPFSLNLTNVEPDIVYCVEVYNITCGGRELLISDCNVTETSYTSDVLQAGYIYEYTVTPRSNVEGAQNGISKTITEQFMNLTLLTRSETFSNIEKGDNMIQLTLEAQIQMQAVYQVDAASYLLSLVPLDGSEKESLLMSTIAVKNGSSVLLKATLPYRRLWNYTVLANDCEEHSLLETNELSTHDIQNISVTSPQPGEVRVTGDFIDGSTATGLLVVVYSLTNDSDIHYTARGSKSQQSRNVHVSVPGLAGGEYKTSVFVVEENGLPFERVATSPKLMKKRQLRSLMSGDVVTPPSSSIEYSLQSTSTGVCITCTFLDSSATDCVAVIHQPISQLSSSGLMNITSRIFSRSGDTASGCIEVVNMEDYQVGVFEWRQAPLVTETKDHSSSIEGSTVGIVLGVLVFILLAVVVVVVSLIMVRKRKRTKLPDVETRVPPTTPSSDDVNQPGNEATVINIYESIPVTNHQGSRAELDESADEVSEPLLSNPSLPLPTRQGENRVYSDGSSDSSPSSEDTIETDLPSPSESNDDRTLGDPGPLYDLPQLPGSTVVPPPTDIRHQSNEEESHPPVPPRTEDSKVLVQESSNRSPSAQDNTSTNIQSPTDPTYAEPQPTGRAPVQTPPTEEQALQSPPPVPPITEDREVLLEGSSGSSRTQGSPHIAVSIDLAPSSDPTYAEPQPPAVDQPLSKEKQQVSPSGESGGPTYAQPVLSSPSGVTCPPPVTEPVVYEDVKGFKNSEGQQYAMLGDLNTSKKVCTPDDSDQKKTVYCVIQPHSRGPTTTAVSVGLDTGSQKNKPTTETDPPFTVEYIFPTLLFMASKWEALGEALSLDEDRLDEIFTNNETDEACLHDMLELYMKRSDLKHNWEEIREAKSKVEEKDGGTEELGPTVPEKEHFLDPPLCQSTTSCIVPSPVMKKKRNVFSSGRIASRDLPLSQTDKYSNGDEVISENGENYSAQCNTMVPPPIPPHRPTDVCTISKDVCDVSSTGHDQPTEISTVEIPSNCGTTDEIHDKQEQTSEEVDINKQTNKQTGDEDVDAYDVQTFSRCDGQEKMKIRNISHDEDDDNDIFASAQHVPCEEENVDDHVQYKPCIYSHSQDNIDSNGVKIHTEDPKRTNMDEVLPQIDFALEFPFQLFHGIEENQVVEHHQPALCQAQPYDLDYLSDEQSSEHGYCSPWDASVLPTHVDTSLEHMSQPCFDHNSQNKEYYRTTLCQESEVDKTDYETALRKQLNIGGAPIPREREESECGDLPDLCQSMKKSTYSNLGKLSMQKKAGDSAPSNLSCLSKQATAIQHNICTKKQMNGKNKLRDILHNDHDGTCSFIVPVHKQMHNQERTQCESLLLNLCCEDFRYSFSHLIQGSSSVG